MLIAFILSLLISTLIYKKSQPYLK
jgi:hypothetical protein